MRKPTLCKAPQKCEDCRAFVPIEDSVYTESGWDCGYHFECAFGHTKSEYLYHNFMNQYNKWKEKQDKL